MDATLEVVRRFNAAFNAHAVEALMRLTTGDCVFQDTYPAPDGTRHAGQAAVRWTYSWGAGHVRGVDVLRVRDGKVAEKLSYVKG
jgi:ketosteroid isomerase-like protein